MEQKKKNNGHSLQVSDWLEINYVCAGFLQISTAAQGVGVHETISLNDIVADREGYILAYLSNEN